MASIKTTNFKFNEEDFSFDDDGNLDFSFQRDVNGDGLQSGEYITSVNSSEALDSGGNLKEGYLEEEVKFQIELGGGSNPEKTPFQTQKFYYKIEKQQSHNGFKSTIVYLYTTENPCNETSTTNRFLYWKDTSDSPIGELLYTTENLSDRFDGQPFTYIKFPEFDDYLYRLLRNRQYRADRNQKISCNTNTQLIYGDVNRDGEITQEDANLILSYVNNPSIFDEEQKLLADVSGNEVVTPTDAALVLQYIRGTIDNPNNKTGKPFQPSSDNGSGGGGGGPSGPENPDVLNPNVE